MISQEPGCSTSSDGTLPVVDGVFYFALLLLPFILYICLSGGRDLNQQAEITVNDQQGAIFYPCCNCLFLTVVIMVTLVYLITGISAAVGLFSGCTNAISISLGIFVLLLYPFGLLAGIQGIIILCIMLPDSCNVCANLCCNYN